jgi:hypothetical protein
LGYIYLELNCQKSAVVNKFLLIFICPRVHSVCQMEEKLVFFGCGLIYARRENGRLKQTSRHLHGSASVFRHVHPAPRRQWNTRQRRTGVWKAERLLWKNEWRVALENSEWEGGWALKQNVMQVFFFFNLKKTVWGVEGWYRRGLDRLG